MAFAALARADYAGIAVLIFTSMVPPLVYAFWERPLALRAYLALAAAPNAAVGAVGLCEFFARPEWRAARAAAFVACGVVGVVPLLHHVWAAGEPGAAEGDSVQPAVQSPEAVHHCAGSEALHAAGPNPAPAFHRISELVWLSGG